MRLNLMRNLTLISIAVISCSVSGSNLPPSSFLQDPNHVLIAPEAIQFVENNFENIDAVSLPAKQSLYYLVSRFYKCVSPEVLDDHEAFQINFQGQIKMPLRNRVGMRFVILKPGQVITDLPEYSQDRHKMVKDIYPNMKDDPSGRRLQESVSAEGSHRMMVLSAGDPQPYLFGVYQVSYHEFAHFIHLSALGSEDVNQIHNLYAQAARREAFLDDYAATNEFEYFAQGVEAYLSKFKMDARSLAWVYWKSSGADLKKVDPELFLFIENLIGRCSQ